MLRTVHHNDPERTSLGMRGIANEPRGARVGLIGMLIFLAWMMGACTASVDLVKTRRARIELLPSDTHELYQVSAFQEGGELVLYGKVKLVCGFCILPGYVDIAIVSKDGKLVHSASMPYVDRGRRRGGWFGAHFRARIPISVPVGARIRLAFHGEHCHRGMTFTTRNNWAVPRRESK